MTGRVNEVTKSRLRKDFGTRDQPRRIETYDSRDEGPVHEDREDIQEAVDGGA